MLRVECRGREHEIILTWSLLTGKAHIYVDSREIFRQEPVKDEIFNPFSASFRHEFDLPNPKFNGEHRIGIRCYSRTPLGAKNMDVDATGGKFRQYELTVDGLSYFRMPAMFELGTERMWSKVGRMGLMRMESEQVDAHRGGGTHGKHHARSQSADFERRTGRMVDEYYFDKAKQRSVGGGRYGQSISKTEHKAMTPRSESEEERMMRIAMEVSMKDDERDIIGGGHHHGNNNGVANRKSTNENDSSFGNGQKESINHRPARKTTGKMESIGEDNLIDFGGANEAAKALSHISISRQTTSDVSVLGDDDATSASFVLDTAWGSQQQPTAMSPRQTYVGGQIYNNHQQQQPPSPYHDPTFRTKYASQQVWSSGGTLSSNPTTPRGGGGIGLPSDASFAVPPPPTWDDYNNAFGGSMMNMGASVMGGSVVSPASLGMTSPLTQQQPYGVQQQQASMWQSPSYAAPTNGVAVGVAPATAPAMAPPVAKINKFDPLRADPFAS